MHHLYGDKNQNRKATKNDKYKQKTTTHTLALGTMHSIKQRIHNKGKQGTRNQKKK